MTLQRTPAAAKEKSDFNEKSLGAPYGTKLLRDTTAGSPVIEMRYITCTYRG